MAAILNPLKNNCNRGIIDAAATGFKTPDQGNQCAKGESTRGH